MINNKVLCFTTSYHRPYYLYNTIGNLLNQTYSKFDYAVGISIDEEKDISQYENLLADFYKDKRLKCFFHKNLSQHDNYLYPIKQLDYSKYNIFIKIDDDDIYKKNYIQDMVKIYQKYPIDILSSNIKYQINNHKILSGHFDNVAGYWHEDLSSKTKFGMPFTYIFNKKCLNIILNTTTKELAKIHPFEDAGWRRLWRQHGIKSLVMDNIDSAIYHIHGKNISSHNSLISKDSEYIFIDTKIHCFTFCKHFCWESYLFCNKRDGRVYNIENNDYGSFTINQDLLLIKWDNYSHEEKFQKQYSNNTFHYVFIK